MAPLTFRASEALRLFSRCMTQWNVGMGGATGLNYATCHRDVADAIDVDWADSFDLFQSLEAEYLSFMDDRRKADEEERQRESARPKKRR